MATDTLRVLFVLDRMPSHLATADRVRAYNLVRQLARSGHNVDLLGFQDLCASHGDTDIHSFCHQVRPVHMADIEFTRKSRITQLRHMLTGAMHGLPRRVEQFRSESMLHTLRAMMAETRYDIVHFSGIGVAPLLNVVGKGSYGAAVLGLTDATSLLVRSSLAHRYDLTWPARLVEWLQMEKFERWAVGRAHASIVISPRDREHLGSPERLYVVPNGVELPDRVGVHGRDLDVVFLGNMYTAANVDAVLWFVRSVWPRVVAVRPRSTLYVVGRNPHARVRELAGAGIVVTGTVSDVGEYLCRAKILVAPMRFGAGQKTKLLDAFAHGVPVVATREANEGTDATDGVAIMLRDHPEAMARAILDLLGDEAKRAALASNALEFVKAQYSWERAAEQLEKVYERALIHASAISASDA